MFALTSFLSLGGKPEGGTQMFARILFRPSFFLVNTPYIMQY